MFFRNNKQKADDKKTYRRLFVVSVIAGNDPQSPDYHFTIFFTYRCVPFKTTT
jgi:hypothetical protein